MCKTANGPGISTRLYPVRQNGVWLMKLTFDTIRAIAPVPPKTEIIVFDDDVPGFGVRAHLSGSKAFIVQYSIGNKQRRMSLGKVDDWTSAKLGKWPRKSDRGEDGSRSSGRQKVVVGPPVSLYPPLYFRPELVVTPKLFIPCPFDAAGWTP